MFSPGFSHVPHVPGPGPRRPRIRPGPKRWAPAERCTRSMSSGKSRSAAAGPPDPAEASSVEEKKNPSFKGGSHGLTWFSMVQYGLMWFNMV